MSTMTRWILCLMLATMLVNVLPAATHAQDSFYNEAPVLTERVAAGELPPVDQRLPLVPMVVQPNDQVGVYGGTLEIPVSDVETTSRPSRFAGYEPLVRWDPQWRHVIPNLAQDVEASEDATTYTFRLREGVRWSDGTPFTANDLMFWYESVLSNPELTSRPPGWLSTGGVPVVVEKVDDFTVVFRFAQPNGLFLSNLANVFGTSLTAYPRHYLEQFHKDFNPDIDALVAEAGVADWTALFKSKADFNNLEMPKLGAWLVIERGETIVAERNPYYWKIDTDFNQLPYLDRLVFVQVTTSEELQAVLEDDAAHLLFADEFNNFSVQDLDLSAMQEVTLISSNSTYLAIGLNLTHPDPVLRAFFQNREIRIALSHAINRQRMIDELFNGEGQFYQVAPRPESPYYNEVMATQYTAFDPEVANRLLDAAGYDQRDAEGFRLAPDGTRLTFQLQHSTEDNSRQAQMLTMISEDWRALGLDVSVAIFGADRQEEWEGMLFSGMFNNYVSEGVGGLDVILEASYYFPIHPFGSFYASGWGYWYLDPNGESAVEPPAPVQRQMDLYNQIKATTDTELQAELVSELLQIASDEFLVMGTVLDPNSVMLISNNLHNVPTLIPSAFTYPTPAPTNPSQYFIDPQQQQ